MKKIRLICALALVVCPVTVSCFTVSAANVTGTVGDCSWVLADGNLMISGGAMPNYTQSGETPWYNSYASSIESVVITGSVTHIGSHAFSELANLRTVTITAKSTNKLTICDGAFTGCPSLESVILPDNLVSIGSGAFKGCSALTVSTAYDSYASLVAEEYGINCSYGDSSEFTNNTHSAALFSNGQLSVTVAVDEPIKGEYIHMAFFNDKDEVVNYIVTPTPTGTATNSVSISVDEERVGDAAYLKVFIWDSLKTCKPVSPAEKITIKK